MFNRAHDAKIRSAAFQWLADQVGRFGDVFSRRVLEHGFILDNLRIPLVGPSGIFKPQVLDEVPISITTSPESRYPDAFGSDGLLSYRYRGTDANHRDNRGLRTAMVNGLPLVYFYGVSPGRYVASWPVFVVGDNQAGLIFSIAVDDKSHLGLAPEIQVRTGEVQEDAAACRRAYITSTVRVRLHQRTFRERVLDAYRRQCAFCRFRHEELLDAAHIIPDLEPEGEPIVQNGLALCNLHHAAFDKFFIGVRPDYVIEVRPDILKEGDGPTLRHAIQALQGQKLILPTKSSLWPDADRLQKRYEQYREIAR